jgi:hypothetical protein
VKARGNQPHIELVTVDSGVLNQVQSDSAGNHPTIILKGDGARPCATPSADFSCE